MPVLLRNKLNFHFWNPYFIQFLDRIYSVGRATVAFYQLKKTPVPNIKPIQRRLQQKPLRPTLSPITAPDRISQLEIHIALWFRPLLTLSWFFACVHFLRVVIHQHARLRRTHMCRETFFDPGSFWACYQKPASRKITLQKGILRVVPPRVGIAIFWLRSEFPSCEIHRAQWEHLCVSLQQGSKFWHLYVFLAEPRCKIFQPRTGGPWLGDYDWSVLGWKKLNKNHTNVLA